MTSRWQHRCSVRAERGPVADPVILTHTSTHTQSGLVCILSGLTHSGGLASDALRAAWRSAPPRSPNRGDRIGSEMRVGLKIEPLCFFLKRAKHPAAFMQGAELAAGIWTTEGLSPPRPAPLPLRTGSPVKANRPLYGCQGAFTATVHPITPPLS